MRIGGFQKVSFIDYPKKVAAVVFAQGCNFRCSFCHNTELVLPSCFSEPLDEHEILAFLKTRADKLQGVVITGGEPTLQGDLPAFMRAVKAMGFALKLDTNGSRPDMIRRLLDDQIVDFIAMDLKAPLARYKEMVGVEVNTALLRESIRIIKDSGIEFQFRTTLVKPLIDPSEIADIQALIPDVLDHYLLQAFVPRENVLDVRLLDQGHYSDEEFADIRSIWQTAAVSRV